MTLGMEINLGHLLTIVAFVMSGVGFVWTMKKELAIMTQRVTNVEENMKKLSDVLVVIARQDGRLNMMDQQLQDLRRARGWPYRYDEKHED